MELPDDRDWFERQREKFLDEVKDIPLFQWVRLGICFGLLRWFDFAERMIIAGRAVEKTMTIYQMGIMDRDNGTSMVDTIGNIYIQSLMFEGIAIIVVGFILWLLLLKYFGLPKRLFKKSVKR